MSPRLPRITPGELLRALHRDGWEEIRQTGSHVQLRHPTKTGRVTVALHGQRTINPKTRTSALRQAGLTVDELQDLL